MSHTGFFLVVDGVDGCGKSTQLKMLADTLRDKVPEVLLTYEPGDTQVGQVLRSLTLSSSWTIQPFSELLLMIADRVEHVETVIRPALKRNAVVLCDRFSISTFVYQGLLAGIDTETIALLDQRARAGCWPDLYLYLDVPPEVSSLRIMARQTDQSRFDRSPPEIVQRLRTAYKTMMLHFDNVHVIDGNGERDIVHHQIVQLFQASFAEKMNIM
jgi:dTMP kinase